MVLKGVESDLQLLNGKINELAIMADDQEVEKIKAKFKEIVPEYGAG